MKIRDGIVCALVLQTLCAVPLVVSAQVQRVEELKFPPLAEVEIAQPSIVELDNGLTIMLLEDRELPLVNVSARIHTGSRLEPADRVGLASLAGTVMRSGGTKAMSGDDLDDFLESRAAHVETSIGEDAGQASMSCLTEDFEDVLKVFADVLRAPAFAEEKLAIAKNQMMASIARQNDNPDEILRREFREIVYGEDSPYARTETYATVQAISRQDLIDWHATYYHPNRIVLGLVGDFNADRALRLVKRYFGDWKRGVPPEPADVFYRKENPVKVFYVEKNDMTQSNIMMGYLGVLRKNPDYHAIVVMNQVLSGGFGSRLFSNVRSKKGLAYSVHGGVGFDWDHPGVASMFMTTKTETTGEGIEALLEETKRMVTDPPTDDEVAKAKAGILNSFVFNVDSREEILGQQLTYQYYNYPLDWLTRYRTGVERVTTDEVRKAAEKYLHPDRFSILVVGPSQAREELPDDHGAIVQRDISIPQP